MPTYTTGSASAGPYSNLPKGTQDYLANGAPKGQRDNMLFAAACQLRDTGYAQADAETLLIPRAMADGLEEVYARKKIVSAYRRSAREPATGASGANGGGNQNGSSPGAAPHSHNQSSVPRPLPKPIADGFRVLLDACFRPGERAVLGKGAFDSKGDLAIDAGTMMKVEGWHRRLSSKTIEQIYPVKDGLFIRVNPMKGGGKSDADVAIYRHVLVEFDFDQNGNPISKELQYAWLMDSGLPIDAILDSGNRSIQGEVTVDAPDLAEYKRRQALVWDYFKDCHLDPQNKNPSRYCRCPGVERNLYDGTGKLIGVARQELIAVKVGAASWEEWEKGHGAAGQQSNKRDDLKRLLCPKAVGDLPHQPPQQLISGMLYQGGKMSFSGGSKMFKTWNLLHALFCISNGLSYLGFPTATVPVLIFDFELIDYDCRHRLEKIAACYDLPGEKFANLKIIPLRGRSIDFADATTQDVATEIIKASLAGAFALDPLYKALGEHDENSNTDVARVLRPFEQLTVDCGVSFLYNQHFSKGNQAGKTPMDRIAGGGTFARDPDVILTFTQHREPDCFTVDVSQRSFAEVKPFVVRWRFPIFVRDYTLDPEDLEPPKKVGRPKDETANEKIMASIYGAEDSGGLSTARLCAATGFERSTIWRRAKKLIAKGEIIKSVVDKTYQLSPKNAQKWAKISKIDS
jgi:RecA-family ATPase/biotin operon repressor